MSAPAPAPASDPIAVGALDLAALLCSRVCHDLISPVGAIVNGIEVMEEDKNEETKAFALDLIKKSAYQASAKLQVCRLAFGAAGGLVVFVALMQLLRQRTARRKAAAAALLVSAPHPLPVNATRS